jgi:hypothetical protein
MYMSDRGYQKCLKLGLKWMGLDSGFCREPFGHWDDSEDEKLHGEFQTLKKQMGTTGIPFIERL